MMRGGAGTVAVPARGAGASPVSRLKPLLQKRAPAATRARRISNSYRKTA